MGKGRRKILRPEEYANGVIAGDRIALARAITLIESVHPQDRKIADEVLRLCLHKSSHSIRIAITGAPGVGKSSLIEGLGKLLVKEYERNVAVLAVDPSSTNSKGSILGDKTRMTELAASSQAFVRPSPSSGSIGGIAFRTRDVMILCEAAGYDTILIETVGVGQAQVAVHSLSDFFILLVLAGSGDILQAIKRGIVEMADLILITKAEGDNLEAAQVARSEHKLALGFHPKKESGWLPRVQVCSALENHGIKDIWLAVQEYIKEASENGYFIHNRKEQTTAWLKEKLQEKMSFAIDKIISGVENNSKDMQWQDDLLSGRTSPGEMAERLWDQYTKNKGGP